MILIDVSHTCHSASQSGIQQVCRNLFVELGKRERVLPIVYDPFAQRFRELDKKERSLLQIAESTPPNGKRGSKWSWKQKLRGTLHGLKSNDHFANHGNVAAILVPEIPSPKIPIEAYLDLKSKTGGKLHAVFHDAIALRMPEITPQKTVDYFPEYLSKLARFDAIAAVSQASKDDLLHFWQEYGIQRTPPVSTIPLGVSIPPQAASPKADIPTEFEHRILFVGSIEGRKNHLEALKAIENLWQQNYAFSLTLIGGSVPETASDALALLEQLIARKRPIQWLGAVNGNTLLNAYRACTFTLYPSLLEGFGLPPLESISHGKPCVCTDRGGLAETASDGGCLIANGTSAADLESALREMLENRELYNKLVVQAEKRFVRTWEQYSAEIVEWFVKC